MTTTYDVSSEGLTFGNIDTTTLNGAIRAIDTGPAGDDVINITGNIRLTTDLLAFNLSSRSQPAVNCGTSCIAQPPTVLA